MIIPLKEPSKKQINLRLYILYALLTICFLVIAIQLILLAHKGQIEKNKTQHQSPSSPSFNQNSFRPTIYDREGNLLASSIATHSIYADPAHILDINETLNALKLYLPNLDEKKLKEKLDSNKRFVWVERHLTPTLYQKIHNLGLPGIFAKKEYKRIYPLADLLAHIIGFTDSDGNGLKGIERLIGTESFEKAQKRKEKIQLSIDIRIQHILTEELKKTIKEFEAIGGLGIIMDINNGEILAMQSLPTFDPHKRNNIPQEALFNKPTQGVYELGSIFKILNHAICLESGKVTINDSFDASKPLKIGNFTINDFMAKKRVLSVPEILIYSSNIGSAKMARLIGSEIQQDYMRALGLLYTSPIELLEKTDPLLPSPWREANTMTISYGYGLAASPIQLISAVAACLNGGVLYPPTLFKKEENEPSYGERIFSEETSFLMRDLLYQATPKGYNHSAEVKGFFVGGKTGTSLKANTKKPKKQNKNYSDSQRIASFIGAFPIYNPHYIILIIIDEPKGQKKTYGLATGGWVAAPVSARIIRKITPILNLKPQEENRYIFEKLLEFERQKMPQQIIASDKP